MGESTHRFDLPINRKSIIKVIGVGGGGSNAVNNMFKRGIKDVSFVVCNTDEQALKSSPIPNKLQIGIDLTGGLGAGANPEVGKNAAIESKEAIRELLSDGTKMLFVTAGMGGGTGTGAAPIIASTANKLDILTVGIVTLPFSFEGKKKHLQAQKGIKELRQHCDTVLVILNDRLREVLGNLSIGNAFEQADNILTTAAKSIAEIITVPGYVNVDFEDVKTVMKKAGAAVMGAGQATGEDRALKAAELALSSPLLDYKDIHGAKKILLSIVAGQEAELQMDELAVITDYIQSQVGDDAEMIFGHGSEVQLKEAIRVTVIATGFEKVAYDSATQTEGHTIEESIELQGHLFEKTKQDELPYHKQFGPTTKSHTAQGDRRGTVKYASKQPATDKSTQHELRLPFSNREYKQQYAYQEPQEDIRSKFTSQQETSPTKENLREYLEVPAYLRKNIQLQAIPKLPEQEIVRYQLPEKEDKEDTVANTETTYIQEQKNSKKD